MKVILVLEEMPEMKTMNDSENPPHDFWYTAGFSLYAFLSFFRKQKENLTLHQKSFKGNFNAMHPILLRLCCVIEKLQCKRKTTLSSFRAIKMLLYHEPTGAGKGGAENVAATRLMASIHSFISRKFLQKYKRKDK